MQVELVNVLEPRNDPRHVIWKGGVLLGVLDSRENWLTRQQWAGPVAAESSTLNTAAGKEQQQQMNMGSSSVGRLGQQQGPGAVNRFAKLFYYCRSQQGT